MPKRKRGVHPLKCFDKVPNVKQLLSSRPAQIASILNIPLPIVQMILQYANDNFFSTLDRAPIPVTFRLGANMNRFSVSGNVIAVANETKIVKFDLDREDFASEYFLDEHAPVSKLWFDSRETPKIIHFEQKNQIYKLNPMGQAMHETVLQQPRGEWDSCVFEDQSVVYVSKTPFIRIKWESQIITMTQTCEAEATCATSGYGDTSILMVGKHLYHLTDDKWVHLATTEYSILNWIFTIFDSFYTIAVHTQQERTYQGYVECFSTLNCGRRVYLVDHMFHSKSNNVAILFRYAEVLVLNLRNFSDKTIYSSSFVHRIYFYLPNDYILSISTQGNWQIGNLEGLVLWSGGQNGWTKANHTIDGRPVFLHKNQLTIWS